MQWSGSTDPRSLLAVGSLGYWLTIHSIVSPILTADTRMVNKMKEENRIKWTENVGEEEKPRPPSHFSVWHQLIVTKLPSVHMLGWESWPTINRSTQQPDRDRRKKKKKVCIPAKTAYIHIYKCVRMVYTQYGTWRTTWKPHEPSRRRKSHTIGH